MARPREKTSRAVKLKLPVVLALCCSSLLCGLLIGQRQVASPAVGQSHEYSGRRKLEAVSEEQLASLQAEEIKPEILPVTDTGRTYLSRFNYQVLSFKPRALLFRNFAPPEKCDEIVELAEKQLAPSGLALRKGETDETTKDIRTSSGTFLAAHQDASGSLDWVERAISEATMIPIEHGEAFNVLRYEIGQKYNSHYDYFATDEYGPQDSQRMASFLLYLSDVEEGGETMFPYENGENMDGRYDFQACIGLKVKPRKGDGLLFYSLTPNGTYDKTSLHGSCPVIRGQKWVATKWIRDKPIR
eukprot:TRINITY_DN1096_c0_g2_i1.p1 TRINITY_DN1096_c0_g2~~TRINITY_DN1096_c0_g2_i1.p1  ORF type:complete len:301 (-),score=39.36 TRINITY_DN1096_c0_g2_i1:16-918(-)